MNRSAALLLVVLAPFVLAADVTTKVTLDARGRGDVFMSLTSDVEETTRLGAVADPQVKDLFLVRVLQASPAELTELLRGASFSNIIVSQKVKMTRVRTDVTAEVSDVRPLTTLAGGAVDFSEKPGNYLELNGTLGGALAGRDADLSALSGVHVKIWVVFPGTVREADKAGRVSHVADSVAWQWPADRLLAEGTTVHVRVLPRIEGAPSYWLALILGITALVVIGAVIVLRHGREARL